jgi:osmoprotectant transport system substrate-binding protein
MKEHRCTLADPARAAARLCLGLILTWLVLGLMAVPPAAAQLLVVGAKSFTEQLLLAEMTAELLRAKGYRVDTRTGFATSGIRREQEVGLVDVYWEYTGTSLITFNNVTQKLGGQDAYNRVKELDARKGLIWLTPSKVNNTYALAMRRADAEARNIQSISDLAAQIRRGATFRLASNTEFYIRPDGLMPMQRAYGFEFGRENVARMSTDAVYDTLRDSSEFDVGVVFSTDGRVAAFDFVVLRDDRDYFPSYLLTPVVRKSILDRNPGLATHLNALAEKLDNATMARLNAMIDITKIPVRDVVTAFLQGSGLI